ncbi:MAG TPA: hypothetical protein VFS31_00555, partial [Chitinophagaceae bacterium]|nr:hypothetical protein [Chitinophagaceae bacterium]
GSAYLFKNTGSGWQVLRKISNPAGKEQDNFGASVALDNNRFLVGEANPIKVPEKGSACFGKIN